MTLALRVDFLRALLLKHLTNDTKFPTNLQKCGHPLQITHFTTFRDKGDNKESMAGIVSDGKTSIKCQFTADCCNDFEARTERRFAEVKGGLIKPVKWQFDVVYLPKNNKYKAVVIIDQIALMGSDGESTIGTPVDFNTLPEVFKILNDPKRESIYRGSRTEEVYSSQQSNSQLPSLHQSKRRKVAKEDHHAWTEVKSLKHKDYQITPGQQDLLATDAAWFTPENIASYQTGPEVEEQLVTQEAPPTINGLDHPPLSSPEMESASHGESQFHTQAVGLAESQSNGEDAVEETSAEKALERDHTPPHEPAVPAPLEDVETEGGDIEPEGEKTFEWESSPERPKKSKMDIPPPLDSDEEATSKSSPVSSIVSEFSDEEPGSSPPDHTEVLFEADREERRRGILEQEVEVLEDLIEASMHVSTGDLMTQNQSNVEKEVVVEEVEVTETVVEEEESEDAEDGDDIEEPQMISDKADTEEVDTREVEEMEEIEQTEAPISQAQDQEESDGPEVVEMDVEVIEEFIEITETVTPMVEPEQQSRHPLSVLSTTQDESASTQYPASTPSIPGPPAQEYQPTQSDSKISTTASNEPSQVTPTIPATQTPNLLQPPTYLSIRSPSPSNLQQETPISYPSATPQTGITPSAQIQVHETPFVPRQSHEEETPFTSPNTRISATAPAAISPEKQPAETTEVVPKHKRDRHIGPVVPKFSRREKKTTYDLEALLLDDLKEFYGASLKPVKIRTPTPRLSRSPRQQILVSPRRTPTPRVTSRRQTPVPRSSPRKQTSRKNTPLEMEKAEPMEEIIQETHKERLLVQETIQSPTMEPDLPSSQPSRKVDPNPAEIPPSPPHRSQSKAPSPQTQHYYNAPSPEIPSSTQDNSQAQTFDVTNSRWGRFAAHWRRFSTI